MPTYVRFPLNTHSANALKSDGRAGAFHTTCGPTRCSQQSEEDRGRVNRKRQTESISLASTDSLSQSESISFNLRVGLSPCHGEHPQRCWEGCPAVGIIFLPPPCAAHAKEGPMSQQWTCVLTLSAMSLAPAAKASRAPQQILFPEV